MKLKTKDILFVVVQFMLFVIYCFKIEIYTFKTNYLIRSTGIVLLIFGFLLGTISVLQLNRNLSPFPTPKLISSLITHGSYQYIRHPIYTGILLFLFGYALYDGSTFKVLVSLLLLILFYFKTEYEEQQLSIKYSNYQTYKKTTGRFIPKF
jgi:protein-S-isoprenylcysteine O-methyltransferase Ste14